MKNKKMDTVSRCLLLRFLGEEPRQ